MRQHNAQPLDTGEACPFSMAENTTPLCQKHWLALVCPQFTKALPVAYNYFQTPFKWTKNAGLIWIQCVDSTWITLFTHESTLDTKVGQTLLLTQGQIQVEVGGQGGYVVWQ